MWLRARAFWDGFRSNKHEGTPEAGEWNNIHPVANRRWHDYSCEGPYTGWCRSTANRPQGLAESSGIRITVFSKRSNTHKALSVEDRLDCGDEVLGDP